MAHDRPSGVWAKDKPRDNLLELPEVHMKWREEHNEQIRRANGTAHDCKLLILGDAMVEGWVKSPFGRENWVPQVEKPDTKAIWEKEFKQYGAIQFAIGGDRIQDLVWRLTNGLLMGHLRPHVIAIHIGTNDISTGEDEVTVRDEYERLLQLLMKKLPLAHILIIGMLPRGEQKRTSEWQTLTWERKNPYWKPIKFVNQWLQGWTFLDQGANGTLTLRGAKYVDCMKPFFVRQRNSEPEEGIIPAKLMPDGLHLSLEGYRVLADCIRPRLTKMLEDKDGPDPALPADRFDKWGKYQETHLQRVTG